LTETDDTGSSTGPLTNACSLALAGPGLDERYFLPHLVHCAAQWGSQPNWPTHLATRRKWF